MRAIFERGIGCDRAVVLEGDGLVEAHLELPGLRAGDILHARLLEARGGRGIVGLDPRAPIDGLPPSLSEGAVIAVEVLRAPITEPDRPRPPRLRFAGDAPQRRGPDLRARLLARGLALTEALPGGPDLLEAAGWSEALEEARTGEVGFDGGRLLIERTAAFEAVIDVDGHLSPPALALAGATATAAAVRRLDLAGAIVADLPTVGDGTIRRAVGERLDGALPPPFERTAMNGFGLVQIIRPKARPSLMDHAQGDPAAMAALALLRQAERVSGPGLTLLAASPAVLRWIEARPELVPELERRSGRPARLQADGALAMWGGHVHAQPLPDL